MKLQALIKTRLSVSAEFPAEFWEILWLHSSKHTIERDGAIDDFHSLYLHPRVFLSSLIPEHIHLCLDSIWIL